jgi:hypothetical protein
MKVFRAAQASLIVLAVACVGSPALARLVVRSYDTSSYPEKGILSFVVDARDEGGPLEGLARGDWGLQYGEAALKVSAAAEGYRAKEIVTSILFLVPATPTFSGSDEPDVAKDRASTPLRYVLEGLQTLKTQVDDKDFLAIGCYDGAKADPVRLSDGVKKAGTVTVPTDVQAVTGRCSTGGGTPRLQTLLAQAVKQWIAKKADAQRFVVVLVADGNSSEAVSPTWWKGLLGDSENRWLELYVVGLEDGGDLGNLTALGQGGVSSTVPVRQNLPSELAKLGPWVSGSGVYAVTYVLDDPVRSKNAELVLVAGAGKSVQRSDPASVGRLEPKRSWVGVVILVVGSLVGIVLVVVVIRLVMLLMASRRRSRDEEAARRAAQANEGPSRGHLLVREGPCAGQTFHLVGEVTYMGRSPDNHVSLSDGSVGKRHCSITIKDRSFQVEDLQSVNGVFLNGQRVLKAFLKDGDSIRLGSSEMQFRL